MEQAAFEEFIAYRHVNVPLGIKTAENLTREKW
jgi:hypothetical protein